MSQFTVQDGTTACHGASEEAVRLCRNGIACKGMQKIDAQVHEGVYIKDMQDKRVRFLETES